MSEFDQAAFDRKKREIDTLMTEYEEEAAAAEAWFKDWKARQPKGFRAKRRRRPTAENVAE